MDGTKLAEDTKLAKQSLMNKMVKIRKDYHFQVELSFGDQKKSPKKQIPTPSESSQAPESPQRSATGPSVTPKSKPRLNATGGSRKRDSPMDLTPAACKQEGDASPTPAKRQKQTPQSQGGGSTSDEKSEAESWAASDSVDMYQSYN